MYTIVAFKRPSPNHEGSFQVAFEIRNMGCFNGFNTEGAFTPTPAGSYKSPKFDLVVDQVTSDGFLPNQRITHLHGYQQRPNTGPTCPLMVPGRNDDALTLLKGETNWECLGIGFMAYSCGDVSYPYEEGEYNSHGQVVRPGTQDVWNRSTYHATGADKLDHRIVALLCHSGIERDYYDAFDDQRFNSQRKCTPNESFLRKLISCFNDYDHNGSAARQTFKSSKMYNAMSYNSSYYGALFEMVGSERPSGLAISYLQAWRNGIEMCWTGWSNKKGEQGVLRDIYAATNSKYDPMPFIALLSHHGTDSDNIAFAGGYYQAYAMKFGVLETGHLFRDTTAMTVEGRYRKGEQAASLEANLRVKINASNDDIKAQFETARTAVEDIMAAKSVYANVPELFGMAITARQYQSNGPAQLQNIEQAVTIVRNWFNSMVSPALNVDSRYRDLRGYADALVSFRPKAVKAKQAAPNLAEGPLPFNQWVGQAEGGVPEATEPEGDLVQPTVRGDAGADPAHVPTPVDNIING